jgi:hypothetical protein
MARLIDPSFARLPTAPAAARIAWPRWSVGMSPNPTKYLVPPSRDGAPRSRGPASESARRVASSRVSAAVMVAVEVMVSLSGGEWGGVC